MAKAKPSLTLSQMENELGYQADSLTNFYGSVIRFYSDLRPIPKSPHEKIKQEYEKQKYRQGYNIMPEQYLPELDVVQVKQTSALNSLS